MIRKGDAPWWVLEAKKHPESAPAIIEELAKRLAELDAENERLRGEVVRLQRRAPAATPDRSELTALRRQVTALQGLLEEETVPEPAVVFLSNWLQSARMPLSQIERLARENRPVLGSQAALGLRSLLLARPHDELLLLTSSGRGLRALPSEIPALAEGGDWPAREGAVLAADERLAAAVAVGQPPRFWTVVTRRSHVRQFLRIRFEQRLDQGDRLIESTIHRDEPAALVNGDRGDLLLLTRWGKGVRFPQRAIAGPGSLALELEPDDEVIAALPLPADTEILIVTAAGYAIRRSTTQFKARSSPGGKGRPLIKAYDALGVFPYVPQSRLLYLTYSGRATFISVAEIPHHERASKGTQVCDFGRDPAVSVALVPDVP